MKVCKLDGCDQPVSGARAEFCKPAHRAKYWRTAHVIAEPVGPGPRSGPKARSGSQISYRKAVAVLGAYLGSTRKAELVLRGALPEKQAARERQRDQT